jgi:hypothetical protein
MNLVNVVNSDQPGPSHVPKLHNWLSRKAAVARRVMLHLVQLNRSYGPETFSVMTAAFDRACQCVTEQMNGSDDVKKTLALIILRHGDRGEGDPERPAETTFPEWTGTDRSAIEDRSNQLMAARHSALAAGPATGAHAARSGPRSQLHAGIGSVSETSEKSEPYSSAEVEHVGR